MEDAVCRGDLRSVEECIRIGSYWSGWKKNGSLLVLAIEKGYEDIALALLAAQTLSCEDLKTALDAATDKGLEGLVQKLIGQLMSSEKLSQERVIQLLRYACHEGDFLAVRDLLMSGCSISILSKEEQEMLLLRAFDMSDKFVGNVMVAQILLQNVPVSILSSRQEERLLSCACREGDLSVVDTLIANGCNVNSDNWGVQTTQHLHLKVTPLMLAAHEGHEEIVKKLILANAKVGKQDSTGLTALHYAAAKSHIQCGILLAEGGASLRTKDNHSKMALDVACNTAFCKAVKQAVSFTTRRSLCVIGNAGGGKSTLIAALKAERRSIFGKFYNHFRRVDDRRKRTAGIEPIPHSSQKYGEVLFFDFAGQHEYHGPHQMFLESLLSKPGVPMTLLLVVKATDKEEAIMHQLHRWLSPVALMANTASSPEVIVIGSFLDKVRSKEEGAAKLTRCIEATRKDLEELPLDIVGSCLLNCCQPQSEGMDQLCRYIEKVPVPEFRATHTQYSLAWVLSQIRSTPMPQAVQLQEFSRWMQDNKHDLPQSMPPPEKVCQDLSAAGHTLYLPNKVDPSKSWLVLDLPGILHDVYGTLFSRSKAIVNAVGLLHCQHLVEFFPQLDLELVQQLLLSLEFCIPVDLSVLNLEVTKLTQSEDASGWLFFPALISAKLPQSISEGLLCQSAQYLCWQLTTSKKHSISARVLQTILLRLAAHFVVQLHDEEGIPQLCCSIWSSGIAWQSKRGVDITVRITNNRTIQVVGASDTSADKSFGYTSDVISDILAMVRRLSPNLAAAAYIAYLPKTAVLQDDITTRPPKELFLVEDIRNSISGHEEYSLSCKDTFGLSTRLPVSDLFGGWNPSLEDIERILWSQPKLIASQPQSPAEPSKITLTCDWPAASNPPSSHIAVSTGHTATLAAAATDRPLIPTVVATDPPLNHTLTPTAVDPLLPPTSAVHSSSSVAFGAQALLDTSAVPTLDDMNELIVTQAAAKWQNLAFALGVKDFLIDIVSKNNRNDCEGACQDMLKRWLREERHTGGEERTWATLLIALGRADCGELERSLRREHFCNT